MRIHEEFYGKLKAADELSMQAEEEQTETEEEIEAFHKWFYSGMLAVRQSYRKRRKEAGLLLSLPDYELIEQQLLKLAEYAGMDIDSDIQNGIGEISLISNCISLRKSEEPELMAALTNAIRRADDLRLCGAERYGQTLIRLLLKYELDP